MDCSRIQVTHERCDTRGLSRTQATRDLSEPVASFFVKHVGLKNEEAYAYGFAARSFVANIPYCPVDICIPLFHQAKEASATHSNGTCQPCETAEVKTNRRSEQNLAAGEDTI